MGAKSKIEWTDASWNAIRAMRINLLDGGHAEQVGKIGWHCEHVSEGCRNCYAESMNRRLGTGLDFKPGNLYREARKGYVNGESHLFLDEKMLTAPLRWKKPRRIFVGSMTDLFADFVPDAFIDRIFAVMALCPQHTFQILTKRPERMRAYFADDFVGNRIGTAMAEISDAADRSRIHHEHPGWAFEPAGCDWEPLPNVWLGTSCEDQGAADARIPHLFATPAAIRFLSCEPLLGEINILKFLVEPTPKAFRLLSQFYGPDGFDETGSQPERTMQRIKPLPLHWVIAGGESGHEARPMHPDCPRSLRDQCAAAGIPFFFKQWGEFAPGEIAGDFLNPEKAARGKRFFGDKWSDCWSEPDGHIDDEPDVYRVGKANAGRTLDGKTHDAYPEAL